MLRSLWGKAVSCRLLLDLGWSPKKGPEARNAVLGSDGVLTATLLAPPGNSVPITDSMHVPVFRPQVCTTTLRQGPAVCVSDATGEGQGEAPAGTLAWRLWSEGAGRGGCHSSGTEVSGRCLLFGCTSSPHHLSGCVCFCPHEPGIECWSLPRAAFICLSVFILQPGPP